MLVATGSLPLLLDRLAVRHSNLMATLAELCRAADVDLDLAVSVRSLLPLTRLFAWYLASKVLL